MWISNVGRISASPNMTSELMGRMSLMNMKMFGACNAQQKTYSPNQAWRTSEAGRVTVMPLGRLRDAIAAELRDMIPKSNLEGESNGQNQDN